MKTLLAGIASYKTTVVGVLLTGLVIIQDLTTNGQISFADPQLWIAVSVGVLGFLTRDADTTSEESNLKEP